MNVTKDKIHILIAEGSHPNYFEIPEDFRTDKAIAEFHIPVPPGSPIDLVENAAAALIQEHRPVTIIMACRNCFEGIVFGVDDDIVDSSTRIVDHLVDTISSLLAEARV